MFVGSGVGVSFSGTTHIFSETSGLPLLSNSTKLMVTQATSTHPMLFTFSDLLGVPLLEQTIAIPEKTTFLINPSAEIVPKIPSVVISSKNNYKVQ